MNDGLTSRVTPLARTVQTAAERFAQSPVYAPAVFLVAYGALALDRPAAGLAILVFLFSFLIACLSDIVPLLLPLLLAFCLAFLEPEAMEYPPALLVVMALSVLVAVGWRVYRYRSRIRPGPTFFAMPAVALALFLGGVGSLSPDVYFSAASLYHMAGLGLLPIAVYLVAKTDDGRGRTYAIGDKVCAAMYLCAVFLSYAVVRVFVLHPELLHITDGSAAVFPYMQWRNTAANLTVMLLPAVFYYARRHHPVHLLSACAIYGLSVLTGSRGALVVGLLCMVAGVVYFCYRRPRAWVWVAAVAAAFVLVFLFFGQPLCAFILRFRRLRILEDEGGDYSILDESRAQLFLRGVRDFLAHPLNGVGLAYRGNEDIAPVYGELRIPWYHCAVAQVMGSMGLLGIAAYGYQLYLRLRLIIRGRKSAYTVALLLSYGALLVYSLIDPGLFSPLPFAVLGTLLFVFLEGAQPAENL